MMFTSIVVGVDRSEHAKLALGLLAFIVPVVRRNRRVPL
jgi:hypothetical protein